MEETAKQPRVVATPKAAANIYNDPRFVQTQQKEVSVQSQYLRSIGIIILIPFLIWLPELLGIFKGDPALLLTGLGVNIQRGIAGSPFIDPNIGFTSQSLGFLSAQNVLHGHLPWWNPYNGLGMPLAGEMQPASFLPLTLLLYFHNGIMYYHIAMEIVAGISVYFLLRKMKFSSTAALIGAILFELNGTFIWLDIPEANPAMFLPLLILGIEELFDTARSAKYRGFAIIALAIAFSLYAGFPETAYLDGLLALLWFVVRAVQLRGKTLLSSIGFAAGGLFTGLILAAPILIAFDDFAAHAYLGGHSGTFANTSLPASSLPMQLFPYIYGGINTFNQYDATGTLSSIWGNIGGYLGMFTAVFAVIGVLGKRERALKISLAAWIVISLLKTYGVFPILQIVNLLPLMNSVAFYRYAPPSWEFAAIVLVVFAIDSFEKNEISQRILLIISGSMVTISGLIVLIFGRPEFAHFAAEKNASTWMGYSIGIALLSIAVITGGYFILKGERELGGFLGVLLVGNAALLFFIPTVSYPHAGTVDMGAVQYLQSHLGNSRYYSLGPIQANYSAYYGIASLNYNALPVPSNLVSTINQKLDPYADPAIFNGNYPRTQLQTPSQADEVIQHLAAYEEMGVKYIVDFPTTSPLNTFQSATSKSQYANTVKLVYTNKTTSIYELPVPAPFWEVTNGSCQVLSSTFSQVRTHCSTSATLIRRELYFPGWVASTPNTSFQVDSYQDIFQSINVPQGNNTITFSYAPPNIIIGKILFMIGGLILLGIVIVSFLVRKSEPVLKDQ